MLEMDFATLAEVGVDAQSDVRVCAEETNMKVIAGQGKGVKVISVHTMKVIGGGDINVIARGATFDLKSNAIDAIEVAIEVVD